VFVGTNRELAELGGANGGSGKCHDECGRCGSQWGSGSRVMATMGTCGMSDLGSGTPIEHVTSISGISGERLSAGIGSGVTPAPHSNARITTH
jgi:hypothetical protein